ncbi:hypothetical protein QBC39DRAFT_345451 [Podospora conica]|nr:hypothetical protein QBC39DRAFT_345451 [Schizothecium conicum]
MPSRKSTSHSKVFKSLRREARMHYAFARQPVQVSSASSFPDSEESVPEAVPSSLPMRRLPPLFFYKNMSISTGRKLPVPVTSNPSSATGRKRPAAKQSRNKTAIPRRESSDSESQSSASSPQDSGESLDLPIHSLKLAPPSSSNIFCKRVSVVQNSARKDYGDPQWPCCQCGDDRDSQMVAQRSGRCKACFEEMRYSKYVKKQLSLGQKPVEASLYFLSAK